MKVIELSRCRVNGKKEH